MQAPLGLSIAACTAVAFALTAPVAHACSSVRCANVQLAPSSGVVPANLPAFWVALGSYTSAKGRAVSLVRTDVRESVITVGADLSVESALTVGGTYEATLSIDATADCPPVALTTSFVAGLEAAIPTSLGHTNVVASGRGPTNVGFTSGSCYSTLDTVFVDLEPEFEPGEEVWRPALVQVMAVVDGKPYWLSGEDQPAEEVYPTRGNGRRSLTGGHDRVRVFVACEPIKPGEANSYVLLAPGKHSVKLKGTLAGIGELESTETTIELVCPASDSRTPDAGPAKPDTGTQPTGLADAAPRDEPSSDGGPRGPHANGCSLVSRRGDFTASGSRLAAIFLTASLMARRTRRRGAHRPSAGR